MVYEDKISSFEIELSLFTYPADYEIGLTNALELVFPNIRRVGCYYHYSLIIRKNIKDKFINFISNIDDKILNNIKAFQINILNIPFIIENNINVINDIFDTFNNNIYEKFKSYFKSQWEPIIKVGILNYTFITKEQRSIFTH